MSSGVDSVDDKRAVMVPLGRKGEESNSISPLKSKCIKVNIQCTPKKFYNIVSIYELDLFSK